MKNSTTEATADKPVVFNLCTKIVRKPTFRSIDEFREMTCGEPAVLQVNCDFACEEHAPELARLSDVPWKRKK